MKLCFSRALNYKSIATTMLLACEAYWIRTSDPYPVKVVLWTNWANASFNELRKSKKIAKQIWDLKSEIWNGIIISKDQF